ncbi:MSMEG_0569 family flavin-dependent oxidoreductase [Dactylococcopsis salina]|uniref:Flavin-dependent oxidoreductase, MSMEG_0569 family n=1 Tax=Dactylococcopsis salina (strain PCC 8305) TaxID=13035 RepID=K9YX52_DACS8|nr:MSMEG_0569 family flavin-dependent oxidoreductase [Dactylococcopsis salina]AFZ50905.1 flavin-dependent oxidoreductase, MSMEG_0569 family [Dactylococcopsis salina PCC 8305]
MTLQYSVIIVGGGQAGLAMSYLLKQRSIDHLIFEKHSIGHAWRHQRWDSFCLVTPNWQCQLPGYPYAGYDPNGFMSKSEVVQYLENYARSFAPPLQEGVAVSKLDANEEGFTVETSQGNYTAAQVVIATGGYHTPKIPPMAERLPKGIQQLHSVEYKNPQSLPDQVLVVGTGQSGCQIAEDLHLAGKSVHLATGSAPRAPRRYRGKDVVEWLDLMGYYDLPIDEHPQKETVRHKTNHYLTGRDGGREIDLRKFALEGMHLYGRLADITSGKICFQDNLKDNLDGADAAAEKIKKNIDQYIAENKIDAPVEPPYQSLWKPTNSPLTLDFNQLEAVIWCTGFEMNFNWVELPVFDGKGEPKHDRGVTPVKGLYFLGLPWLYTWGSGRFSGMARDATYIADQIVAKKLQLVG